MIPVLEIYNNVEDALYTEATSEQFLTALEACLAKILTLPQGPAHVLSDLSLVEISVVDDEVICDVHDRFLNDPTPTDVITFPHGDGLGEILVSIDTAKRQAEELHIAPLQELFRYMVHGLLHLHGYLDADPADRALMFSYQEPLVEEFGASWA